MGGAIVLSLLNTNNNLPIDGSILIAQQYGILKKEIFLKHYIKPYFKVLPNLSFSGKGFINVQASDNLKMLKKLSKDPLFIHEPKLKSLNGVTQLMDKAFEDTKNYLKNPFYNTLILVPVNDQIVPRKPLIEILQKPEINKNIGKKFDLGMYVKSYHMMLRDLGDFISREIKEWILDRENVSSFNSFKNPLETLINEPYYHILDKQVNYKNIFLGYSDTKGFVVSDEIIQDSNGNYFLMKDDGTFVKLPKPKPGNKYIIKKKTIKKNKKVF